MSYIDLHVHSTASDGTFTPDQTVALAASAGLKAMALTDHDTLDGIPLAQEAAASLGIQLVPGIELSSQYMGKDIHILGLFVNHKDPAFIQVLENYRNIRDKRNQQLLSNLEAAGIHLTMDMLTQGHPGTIITRAHVARAMTEAGYVSSMDQAFRKYLSYSGKYCPPKASPSPESVVKALLDNHAFVALAHPWQYKLGDRETKNLIRQMKDMGMQGLEVYHSSHNPLEIQKLQKIAEEFSLLPTGGSDFHGSNKPDISIGVGRGNLHIPFQLLEDIEALGFGTSVSKA